MRLSKFLAARNIPCMLPAMTLERDSETPDGLCRRFVEFRFDGDRKISGVVLTYGDLYETPWGYKERIMAGSFGNVGAADVMLNKCHDRARPLCRTGGGGLVLDNSDRELRLEATLPDTNDGNDALKLIKNRVLRGLSVEFIMEKWETDEKTDTRIITRAKLFAVGIVDRPAYPKSTLDPRSKDGRKESKKMDDETIKQVKSLIAEAVKGRSESESLSDFGKSLTEEVGKLVETRAGEISKQAVDEALKKRDEAEAKAERERKERAELEAKTKQEAQDFDDRVHERTELFRLVEGLVPKDTDLKASSNKELLVLACGDEVSDAAERSEDYLRAKVELIAERRAQPNERPPARKPEGNGGAPKGANPAKPPEDVRHFAKPWELRRRSAQPAGPVKTA